jgi:hypothetical protein
MFVAQVVRTGEGRPVLELVLEKLKQESACKTHCNVGTYRKTREVYSPISESSGRLY